MEYISHNIKTGEWYYPSTDCPILVGNTENAIDWNSVITNLLNKNESVVQQEKLRNCKYSLANEYYKSSNFCDAGAEWINYYPGTDFNSEIVPIFGSIINKTNFVRAWISEVRPGKSAPYHWDCDDNEISYIQKGDLLRYTSNISENDPGHITVVGSHVLKSDRVGDIFRWHDHRQWHGSSNMGTTSKFQFNYLTYV